MENDNEMLPAHKLFMPTDMFKGHAMGRIFVQLLFQRKSIGDLTKYDIFKKYVNDPVNDFHLSPIEYYLKDSPQLDIFLKVI